MFPMHGGFMGRKKAISDWRFLHDEVADGFIALSKIRVQESFPMDGVVVRFPGSPNRDYGFVDNVLDFASIQANELSDAPAQWGPQVLGATPLGAGGDSFRVAEGNLFYQRIGVSATYTQFNSIDLPITYLTSYSKLGNPSVIAIVNYVFSTSGSTGWFLRETTSGLLEVFVGAIAGGSTNNFQITTVDAIPNGQNLIAVTVDGSKTAAGAKIYVNDMTTPVDVTVIRDTLASPLISSANRVNCWGIGSTNLINGRGDEWHIWIKELSSADLQTCKSILEQYYIFN